MTVSQTATAIKTRIDALKETLGENEVPLVSKSWIGDIGAPPQVGETIVTIIARNKDNEPFNYPGNNPPAVPYWVPWEILVMVVGPDVTKATLRLYEVTDVLEASLRADLSFGGTCEMGIIPQDSVLFGAGGIDKNDLRPTALIRLKTYYTP